MALTAVTRRLLAGTIISGLLVGHLAAGVEDGNDEPLRFDLLNPDPVAHGERLSAVLGCIGCHAPDLTGEDWSDPELGVLWTANLTHSAARYSTSELAEMIVGGRRADRALIDMPSMLFTQVHPDDISALVAYLKSRPVVGEARPEPTIGPTLAADIESGEFRNSRQWVEELGAATAPDLGAEHAFGRHIVRATCVECHGMDLRGSEAPLMDAPARPDLRVIAAYSAEDFKTLMRTGKGVGNRDLELMGGVARRRYAKFSDRELDAVYAYLRAFAEQSP